MRKPLQAVAGALAFLAALAPTASATSQSPSGDTCSATGSGTTYTLAINLPSSTPEQGGFALGGSGVSVKSIRAPGNPGSFSTKGLPAHTTGAWILTGPGVPPGATVTLALTTSGSFAGASFTVVPASSTSGGSPQMTYYDPVVCDVTRSVLPSNKFTIHYPVKYVSAARVWHLTIITSSAGTVSATEEEPTVGTAGSIQKTAKSLVQARRKTLKSGGRITLVLTPTARGIAALKANNGSIKVRLTIGFAPKDGKPASKVISLTLKQ
jgi:hypothetical protein